MAFSLPFFFPFQQVQGLFCRLVTLDRFIVMSSWQVGLMLFLQSALRILFLFVFSLQSGALCSSSFREVTGLLPLLSFFLSGIAAEVEPTRRVTPPSPPPPPPPTILETGWSGQTQSQVVLTEVWESSDLFLSCIFFFTRKVMQGSSAQALPDSWVFLKKLLCESCPFNFFFLSFPSLSDGVCHGRPQPVVFSSSPKRLKRIPPPPLINFWHGAQNSFCVNKSSQPLLVSVSVNTVGL